MHYTTINGVACEHLSVSDRGLHYGDGLFETIACTGGKLQFWHEHIARLRSGAISLGIDTGSIENFASDVQAMLHQHRIRDCVVKLLLTRGRSERGYRCPSPQKPTRVVILSELPQFPQQYLEQGISACFCQHPVSKNVRLAGIKHLNRLDNVLARSEWQDEYQEGFMQDDSGHIIEGTMSNIFAVKNNLLFTPLLNFSGVNGIIRDQILSIAQQLGITSVITNISKNELINMDEIFICNSLIGIWPVSSLAAKTYLPGPISKLLFQVLQQRIESQ